MNKIIQTVLLNLVLTGTVTVSYSTLAIAQVSKGITTDGTVTIRATGVGKNIDKAINNAEQIALNALLFRGVPNSIQQKPIISTNETEELHKNQNYFNIFYDNLRYKSFIISTVIVSEPIKVKGGNKSIIIDVKYNVQALKTDLEQNNIIRKFGL